MYTRFTGLIIMCFKQGAVHNENIEDIAIISVFYNAAVIKNRMIRAILFRKMELYIVICSTFPRINLFPDACFHVCLLIRTDQIAEAVMGIGEKFVQTLTSGKFNQFPVGEQDMVILQICFVN